MDELNLDQLEKVSAALFTRQKGPAVTVKNDGIVFNSDCLEELKDVEFIQLIIDKDNHKLYLIGCDETDTDALKWCNKNGEKRRPRKLSGKGFADLLFELMNWDVRNRYITKGEKIQLKGHDVLRFNFKEAETETDYKINRIVNLLKNVHGVIIPETEK